MSYGDPSDAERVRLDALLEGGGDAWWDAFYADRARPVPFFVASPDESLAGWVDAAVIRPGRAIDLGCGDGRNAVFLAQRGFTVEAIDYAQGAIDWASQRAAEASVDIRPSRRSVFDVDLDDGAYDLVYDSGCFHHIAPHRRADYVALVGKALTPGGWLGLTCFRPEGGSGYTDAEVYERRSLGGGLGYTEHRLREIWSREPLEVRVVRQMQEQAPGSGRFGKSFLWVMLAQRRSGDTTDRED